MCDKCIDYQRNKDSKPKPDFFELEPGKNHSLRQIACHNCKEDVKGGEGHPKLDNIDKDILDIVMNTPDISESEIAQQVNLSESDLSDRIEKIESVAGDDLPSTKLQMAFTNWGIQVWCVTHDINVYHVDFQGIKLPMFPVDHAGKGIHKSSKKGHYPASPGFIESDPDKDHGEVVIHCHECMKEIETGDLSLTSKSKISPRDYALLQLSNTIWGIQVWCVRHDSNLIHVDFQGKQLPIFPYDHPEDRHKGL